MYGSILLSLFLLLLPEVSTCQLSEKEILPIYDLTIYYFWQLLLLANFDNRGHVQDYMYTTRVYTSHSPQSGKFAGCSRAHSNTIFAQSFSHNSHGRTLFAWSHTVSTLFARSHTILTLFARSQHTITIRTVAHYLFAHYSHGRTLFAH